MNDEQLLRYSRHILLPEIGIEGQARVRTARALVIGAGGLGSPIALYLASAGVGTITLCDNDAVDLTNLQRQIVHRTQSVGRPKVESAKDTLGAINPDTVVECVHERVAGERLGELVATADVVLDGCDNFATRHAVNRACVAHKKPLVSGAGVRFDGQISVFDMRDAAAPCYACLFPEDAGNPQDDEVRCAVMGVFAPLTGIVGCIQAAEALKIIAGAGVTLAGRLMLVDALSMDIRTLTLKKDPACAVCGTGSH